LKLARKKLAKSHLGEFTSMGKQTEFLFIECIRQSQRFDKTLYYLFNKFYKHA